MFYINVYINIKINVLNNIVKVFDIVYDHSLPNATLNTTTTKDKQMTEETQWDDIPLVQLLKLPVAIVLITLAIVFMPITIFLILWFKD